MTIRMAILDSIGASSRPRLLDFGAGTGRFGWPFVVAGDDYVAVDLSRGMLHEFARRGGSNYRRMCPLVQADGRLLPFFDAAFDAVLMIHAFGGMRVWQPVILEARRVLRSPGFLVLGQTEMPPDGVDSRLKQQLASFLAAADVQPGQSNARDDVQRWLQTNAQGGDPVIAAAWNADRTPRGFLDRHRTGARFSALPTSIKEAALSQLRTWAIATFGSLDVVFTEKHEFELQVFKFERANH